MLKSRFIFLSISLFCFLQIQAQSFNITNYGAVGDGKTLNTQAVQKAIDVCNQTGGGQVIVPNGVFIIGTIYLKSNIDLHLEPGSVLRGSTKINDYAPYNEVHYGMIYAENAENITISGSGNIDGNGDNFFDFTHAKRIEWGGTQYTRQKADFRKVLDGGIGDGPIVPQIRPYQMLIFSSCKRVTLKNILITKKEQH